ncbi:MAG: UDP-2,4-diacetamido-2,4,6-trideoxy-beta-L-altropyranose hydrolase [Alphaproteobacteria bacterium]
MTGRIALIRADASVSIGTGHIRRCLTLAHVLRREGWTCRFVVGVESSAVVPELDGSPFEIRVLTPRANHDAHSLEAHTDGGCDLLIVDHYGLDRIYEKACRRFARRILVLDDLPGRIHDADILVDPTPGRTAAMRTDHVPTASIRLVGPSYAPLRPELVAMRFSDRKAPATPRLLVSFGGTDPDNATGRFLAALAAKPLNGWAVDIMLGRGARHVADVMEAVERASGDIRLHLDSPDVAALLVNADLAVGAGGVSALERCCIGLPAVILVLADNQRDPAAAVSDVGAASLASNVEAAVVAVHMLARDAEKRARMAAAATALCDGRGAQRIALRLDPPLAKDGRPVWLRPATMGDAETMLQWQRQPETRRHARVTEAPDEVTHRAWLGAHLTNPDCLLNLVMHDEEPAGVLRLDRKGEKGWEVSILIDAARHGHGVGTAALAAARRLVPEASLLAEVLPENVASHALFLSAGYRRTNGWYEARP